MGKGSDRRGLVRQGPFWPQSMLPSHPSLHLCPQVRSSGFTSHRGPIQLKWGEKRREPSPDQGAGTHCPPLPRKPAKAFSGLRGTESQAGMLGVSSLPALMGLGKQEGVLGFRTRHTPVHLRPARLGTESWGDSTPQDNVAAVKN